MNGSVHASNDINHLFAFSFFPEKHQLALIKQASAQHKNIGTKAGPTRQHHSQLKKDFGLCLKNKKKHVKEKEQLS